MFEYAQVPYWGNYMFDFWALFELKLALKAVIKCNCHLKNALIPNFSKQTNVWNNKQLQQLLNSFTRKQRGFRFPKLKIRN